MKKKITSLLATLLLIISGSTCKKEITKYPFEMEGVWYATATCCDILLEIDKNGSGKMFAHDGKWCRVGQVRAEGKVKYKKKGILYIDKVKFPISSSPETVTSNDSVYAPFENNFSFSGVKKYKVLAKMRLDEEDESSCISWYNFSKFIDY